MTAGSVVVPQIIPIRVPLPGKVKHRIDASIAIEIKSDTPGVTVYYTLNGSKPEPEKRPGIGENSTLRYRGPIYLPVGKVPVKAVAVTGDGRQSAMVTKLFIVDHGSSNEPVCTENTTPQQEHNPDLSKQDSPEGGTEFATWTRGTENSWEDTSKKIKAMETQDGDSNRPPKSPKCLGSPQPTNPNPKCLGSPQPGLQPSTSHSAKVKKTKMTALPWKKLTGTQISRIQRETDFLKCAQCLSPRPSDPFAHFCLQCGFPVPPIPGQRLPPTEQGQDKVICELCGTGNPAHIAYCVTCETRLPGATSPQVPLLLSQPRRVASHRTCSHCGASNHLSANFCACCGVALKGPSKLDSHTNNCSVEGGSEQFTTFTSGSARQPAPPHSPPTAPPGVDKQTQTVGLFYPSGSGIHRKEDHEGLEAGRQELRRGRQPLITAISPGRGYWRKQLDHVCSHLRSYAQNNTEFRALIGEPRMGKMISAVVLEDNYEVSLRISFISAGSERSKGAFLEKPLSVTEGHLLSSVTEGHLLSSKDDVSGSQSSLGNENNLVLSGTPVTKKKYLRKNRIFEGGEKLQESKEEQLLREVGPEGKGETSVVKQLLDEGADPTCLGQDGRPALTVAVMNQHHEAIPLLVQKGADIDQQSGPVNSTALHEAVACGTQGLPCAETLLGCNASIWKKNNRGKIVYDLAVDSGCSSLISLITAKMGQGMLNKISRSRNDRPDVF